MAPRSCTIQQSPYVNPPVNFIKQNELAGAPKKSDVDSNEASTLPKALTLPLILPLFEDLFTKFIKVFIEIMQTQTKVLAVL